MFQDFCTKRVVHLSGIPCGCHSCQSNLQRLILKPFTFLNELDGVLFEPRGLCAIRRFSQTNGLIISDSIYYNINLNNVYFL